MSPEVERPGVERIAAVLAEHKIMGGDTTEAGAFLDCECGEVVWPDTEPFEVHVAAALHAAGVRVVGPDSLDAADGLRARLALLDDIEATVRALSGSGSRLFHDAISRVHVLDHIAAARLTETARTECICPEEVPVHDRACPQYDSDHARSHALSQDPEY